MLWFLIVLAGIGLTVQAWLTIRGFGPPSPPDQLDPDYRDERVLLGAPAAVLDAYRRAAEATSGMRVYGVAADGLLIDARPSAFVLDGDYGSSMRVSVRPAPDGMGTAVCVESMPKTAWISRFSTPTRVNAAFVAKERALRMKARHLGGIAEAM